MSKKKAKQTKEDNVCRLYSPSADIDMLPLYIADFSYYRTVKNFDQRKVREAALKLIDLCVQGLGKKQRMDRRLERFLQDALLKIIVSDNPAAAAPSAFHLCAGQGRLEGDSEDRNLRIAIEVERAICGGKSRDEAINQLLPAEPGG